MNKEMAISKINKYGKVGRIITLIMLVVLGISTVVTLISAIALKVVPNDIFKINIGTQAEIIMNPGAIDTSVDAATLNTIASAINSSDSGLQAGMNLGAVHLDLNEAEVVDNTVIARTNGALNSLSLNKIGNVLFLAVIALVLSFISVFFGFKLCKAIEKCTSPFDDLVINRMRSFAFSLLPWAVFSSIPENVISNLFANNIRFGFSFDLGVIFVVLVILALTSIFKYGAMLQQESDETL